MIWVVVTGVVLLLMAGPLRRGFFATWRTVVPVVLGGLVGLVLSSIFVKSGAPAWMMVVAPAIGALAIGSAGRRSLHDNFPPGDE